MAIWTFLKKSRMAFCPTAIGLALWSIDLQSQMRLVMHLNSLKQIMENSAFAGLSQ